MDYDELLRTVTDPSLRNKFRNFITTGEASDEFLDLLDCTPEYQRIVDRAFREQASELERFAALLNQSRQEPASTR